MSITIIFLMTTMMLFLQSLRALRGFSDKKEKISWSTAYCWVFMTWLSAGIFLAMKVDLP